MSEIDLGVGQALAVRRGPVRLISRGPIWAQGSTAAQRRRALRRLALWPGLTIVTPEQALGGFGLIPLFTPMSTAIWGLDGDLRAGLVGKWRNQLSAAERKGHALVRDRDGALEDLLRAEESQRASRRYRSLSAAFSLALPKASLRLWEWHHCGQVAAAMCFVRHGETATYHLAWASQQARERAIHGLMLWQAALSLRDEGVRWLDLGVVNTEDAPGLARFKLGTGATLRRLGATMLVLPG